MIGTQRGHGLVIHIVDIICACTKQAIGMTSVAGPECHGCQAHEKTQQVRDKRPVTPVTRH